MSDAALAFTHANRLLKLTFAPGSGIDVDTLLPFELSGTESLSTGFTYTLSCLSGNAFLELKDFIGLPVQLAILTDDGAERALCGIVTAATAAGSDGGFSRYLLTLQDPFAILARRINSRVFQDMTVRDIAAVIINEHRQHNSVLAQCVDLRDGCRRTHPKQSWVTQYNESDTAFLNRWFAQEGISWYVEHGDDGVPSEHPKLTLVLFDDASTLPPASAAKVRFHRHDGTENEDVITQWHGVRSLQPGGIGRASYEYKIVTVNTEQQRNAVDQGDYATRLADTLEDNRFDTHHSANDGDDYVRYSKLRMQAHEYAAKQFSGEGTHRELAVGRHFELTQHPVHDQDGPEGRQFVVTGHTLYARNNLPQEAQASAQTLQKQDKAANDATAWAGASDRPLNEPVYRTRFDAVRKGIPIIPAYSHTEHAKPIAPSLMTAIVVGPPGEEIHTDALGRIRVRMGFTRLQDHQHAEGAGATDSDRDSPWIRVAQSWSGTEYGHLWIPRVGDEVLIQYINGDIDRPIVTASVYNGTHRPATFSDAGNLPGNKTLSGIKSKMYKGSGKNEIIWDDSTAEQRIRVATDHGNSALNQGYLVHPRVGGKGEPRGEGFELRSDDYGAIRAGKGLLVSTDVRENARGTHLDSKELTTQLKGALELSTVLSDAAKDHHADLLAVNEEAQRLLQVAEKTYGQSGGTGQKAEVARYDEPVMAFSSPAGILSATPKTQQIAAGENIHISSQKDTNVAIGKRLAMAIKESWSVFVATSGIKLFAGKGKVQIQAQDDAFEATARKDVKVYSVDGNIEISTPHNLTLTAGGCQIKMHNGTIDIKAPGPVNIHGSIKNLTNPAGGSYSGALPAVPMKKGDVELKHFYDNDSEPIKGAKYRAVLADGSVRTGVLDGAGKAVLSGVPKGGIQVAYGVDPRKFEEKKDWYRVKDDTGYEPTEFMKKLQQGFAAGAPNVAIGDAGKAAAAAAGTVGGIAAAAKAASSGADALKAAAVAGVSGLAGKAADAIGATDKLAATARAASVLASGPEGLKAAATEEAGKLAGNATSSLAQNINKPN